jgi:uncharacterized protein (DUF697 family)/GTPase Era involved in 16S rRNA processing
MAGKFSFHLWPPVWQRLSGWFTVDTRRVAEILEQLRSELPTTEVILVGKPQTGKSSIVRALTGISAEIVGEGFRPHTAHTQRYNYPSGDLPLLVFTDTVGLGESSTETANLIQELQAQLSSVVTPGERAAAKILLLTVKINDFATASLHQIVSALRQSHPQVPCLLAVTCLHEVYPSPDSDHPPYPPDYPEVERAFGAIVQQFSSQIDRSAQVDFTLESDGFMPLFYGLEAFVETLSDLLPEAEARMLNQLLNQGAAADQVGNLYREAGRRYILPFAVMAGTLAAVPLPFATMPVLTTLQISLVTLLGRLYGQTLSPAQAGGVVSAIAGGFLAQAIGQQLLKFIPVLGSIIAASWATAYTWALGEAACLYFGELMGGRNPDPEQIKQVMHQSFDQVKTRLKLATPPMVKPDLD